MAFSADLDRTPRGGGYDRSLVTAVEISLKDDGTVNQLIISTQALGVAAV